MTDQSPSPYSGLLAEAEAMADEFAKARPSIDSDGPTESVLRRQSSAIRDLEAENARKDAALADLLREAGQLVDTLALATDRTTRHLYDLDSIAAHSERKLGPALKSARAALSGRAET